MLERLESVRCCSQCGSPWADTLQKTLKHREVILFFGDSAVHLFHSLDAVYAIGCGVDNRSRCWKARTSPKMGLLRQKNGVLATHVGLFIVSVPKDASQGHKIQLLMCKCIRNDTSSVEPLPVKLDVSNTKDHVGDGKRWNDSPQGMELPATLPNTRSVMQQVKKGV